MSLDERSCLAFLQDLLAAAYPTFIMRLLTLILYSIITVLAVKVTLAAKQLAPASMISMLALMWAFIFILSFMKKGEYGDTSLLLCSGLVIAILFLKYMCLVMPGTLLSFFVFAVAVYFYMEKHKGSTVASDASWEYEEHGHWKPVHPQTNNDVETVHLAGRTTGSSIFHNPTTQVDTMYIYDLSTMLQTNVATQFERKIRRNSASSQAGTAARVVHPTRGNSTATPSATASSRQAATVSSTKATALPRPVIDTRLWKSPGQKGLEDNKLYLVNNSSQEYREVQDYFMTTMIGNAIITDIERVENGRQYEAFAVLKKNIPADILKAPRVPALTQKQLVRMLFHGTTRNATRNIISDNATGYIPVLSGSQTGALWGPGTYFAVPFVYFFCNLINLSYCMIDLTLL